MSIVLMPEALRTHFGDQASKELVDLINKINNFTVRDARVRMSIKKCTT